MSKNYQKYYQKREWKRREFGSIKNLNPDTILLEVMVENENDTTEKLIRRFLKKFKKIKLMDEIKDHQYYKKPSEIKREKRKKRLWKILKEKEEREQKEREGN